MENRLKRLTFPVINSLGQRKCEKKFSKPPVIIGACPRSGTTLLLSILSAHPGIYTLKKESWAFLKWKQTGEDAIPVPRRIDRLYRELLVHSIPETCERWCEKTPRNVRYFENIYNYFDGEVKLIHLVRDGRDVMTSYHPKDPENYWVSPERWVHDVRQGLHFSYRDSVLTLRYEDLINDYQTTIRELLDFVDEPYHPNMDDWHKHTKLKKAESWFKPVRKIHAKSVRKWEEPKFKQRVERVMQNDDVVALLSQLGYRT